MSDEEERKALYRYYDGPRSKGRPLYIGQTNHPGRRFGEHQAAKPWIQQAELVTIQWFPASEIDEAERRAIERQHPLYNKTYNGRWRVEFEFSGAVEFQAASPEEIAARLAIVVAAGMAAVWLFDTVANWSVRRRVAAADQEIIVPPARNLFTQDPPHWSATLLAGCLAAAAPSRPDGTRPQAPERLKDVPALRSTLPLAAPSALIQSS
jgi:predicted GIY-YIG superfamily endonuclease